ncbi:MAG: DEAD/DEAH box helicase [Sphingomonadales bacterium]|nr:DEAD/DEAH box helicase [Sphingomonadales bacterium]
MTFYDFDLDPDLLDGLDAMGFRSPTPIQQQAIPIILGGRDLIACAQTGTGKTAAFVLPVIDLILASQKRHLNALILTPTRELAQQIDQQVEGLSYYTSVNSIPIYGGGDGALWDQQHKALKKGADMVIATPGRLISFLNTGNFDFSCLQHLVLDEADRMLDMGFFDDIMRIVSMMPRLRQTLLFSATMPQRIRQLAAVILKNPAEVTLAVAKPAEKIDQRVCKLYDQHKEPLLLEILNDPKYSSILVFCSTKDKVKELGHLLRKRHIPARPFHSDLEQAERENIMRDFKSGKLRIIVGTDVLSRGIDVDGIDLVVNFDAPPDAEDYVHRIGRTARAERSGTAITFINPKDGRRLNAIERLIERTIPRMELPEQIGTVGEWVAESGGWGRRTGRGKSGEGRPGGGGGSRFRGNGGVRPGKGHGSGGGKPRGNGAGRP